MRFFLQWIVDVSRIFGVSAHHSKVDLLDLSVFKQGAHAAGSLTGEGEQNHAGGGAVQAVDGVDPLANLVAQSL